MRLLYTSVLLSVLSVAKAQSSVYQQCGGIGWYVVSLRYFSSSVILTYNNIQDWLNFMREWRGMH